MESNKSIAACYKTAHKIVLDRKTVLVLQFERGQGDPNMKLKLLAIAVLALLASFGSQAFGQSINATTLVAG